MSAPNDIVLYNYAFSPFGKKISAYLALRGIEYGLCEQPLVMPRPDLQLLPVNYRRIPILAIGRDVYLDTRLILRKLEAHSFPNSVAALLGAATPQDVFVEKLLERYMVEGPLFSMTAGCIPSAKASDPTFKKDRQGFLGKSWEKKEMDEGRGECVNYVRGVYQLFEETVLADGRKWVLGGEGPKLADIEAIFLLDFVKDMQLPTDVVSEKIFPKTFSWQERYLKAIEEANKSAPEPVKLDGQAAADHILGSEAVDKHIFVDSNDPSGVQDGVELELYPADWGSEHRDRGRMVGLSGDEVTIAVQSKKDGRIRVHAPRAGFKMEKIGQN